MLEIAIPTKILPKVSLKVTGASASGAGTGTSVLRGWLE
jgi:hypothetical protein